jgi:hypothetical protein
MKKNTPSLIVQLVVLSTLFGGFILFDLNKAVDMLIIQGILNKDIPVQEGENPEQSGDFSKYIDEENAPNTGGMPLDEHLVERAELKNVEEPIVVDQMPGIKK